MTCALVTGEERNSAAPSGTGYGRRHPDGTQTAPRTQPPRLGVPPSPHDADSPTPAPLTAKGEHP
jgi:hypothetical protein